MENEQKILDILLENGIISPDLAAQIKLSSINSGKPITEILKQKNIVSEEDLLMAKAKVLHVPFINLSEKEFPRRF